jgi:Tol biopolymer transport system component
MSATDRLERDLTAWFGDTAAPRTPDYTDDILRQTARVRQRPRWTFPERWLPMSAITFARTTLKPVPWRTLGLLVVLALLVVVAAALLVAGQRHAAPPFGRAANGLVAYSKDGDIYSVDARTGARQAIVTGATNDDRPAFSLDGTRMAFVRTTDGGSVVVLADPDGRNQAVISMTPEADPFPPSWSPDGRSIALIAGDGETGRLLIVDTVGRTIRTTDVVTDYEEVQWRPPDGRQLMVVARVSDAARLVLVSPADGSVEVLSPTGSSGAPLRPGGWSLDGRRFAYAGSGDNLVHVVDVDGGNDVAIRPSVAGHNGGYPRFSNDGQRIVFMEGTLRATSWLSVAPADGSAPAIRVSEEFPEPLGTSYQWAPDDSSIVFQRLGSSDHLVLDPAGGPATSPPWAAEGVESWQRLAP